MNWIEIEDNVITIAGTEVEIDIRAAGLYHAATKGAYDGHQQIEPDEDAAFEVHAVEFRTSKRDLVTRLWVPTGDWRPIPAELLFPQHLEAIAKACIEHHQDLDARACEDAAEARRAA